MFGLFAALPVSSFKFIHFTDIKPTVARRESSTVVDPHSINEVQSGSPNRAVLKLSFSSIWAKLGLHQES